jgi:hypothetical protein
MRRTIQWRFWKNPFGNGEEYVDEKEVGEVKPFYDSYEDREQEPFKIRPVVPTPMGFIPVHPYQSFTESFQFWMGDTNFDITAEVKDIIEATPGVEILDILTRYCFRFAVGKCFNSEEVKVSIQQSLRAMPPKRGEHNPGDIVLDKDTRQKVHLIKEHLKDKFSYWAIYVVPNGEIDVSGSNTQEGYDMQFELYKQCQELAGGIIYTYA